MSPPASPQQPLDPSDALDKGLLADWSRRYRPALTGYFRKRLKSPGEIEDLVQEVFVKLARRQELREVRLIEPYLFQIAAHVLTDFVRSGQVRCRQQHQLYEDNEHPIEASAPETVLAGRQTVDLLLKALEDLPERTREIFMLRRWEEMPNAEIGRMLGISVSAVEKHIGRALVHLKARLERDS